MNKLYIQGVPSDYEAVLVKDGEICEYFTQSLDEEVSVGDVYLVRIEKVTKGNMVFVRLPGGELAFVQAGKKESYKGGMLLPMTVTKLSSGEKLTCGEFKIAVTGRYCVAENKGGSVGISKKIEDEELRNRLFELANGCKPNEASIVIRTSASEADEAEIKKEIENNISKISEIEERARYESEIRLMYKAEPYLHVAVRDLLKEGDELAVNTKEMYNELAPFFAPTLSSEEDILSALCLRGKTAKLFERRVWLKSGANIVIDKTEAMTVIDVNSGRATANTSSERINKEAAKEIARQLRLRNISGIIIVDFIGARDPNIGGELCAYLRKAVKGDRLKVNVVGATELGLVQMTRQRRYKEIMMKPF